MGISDDDRLEIFLAAQADYNDTEMPTLHSSSHHGIRTLSKLSVLLFWGWIMYGNSMVVWVEAFHKGVPFFKKSRVNQARHGGYLWLVPLWSV